MAKKSSEKNKRDIEGLKESIRDAIVHVDALQFEDSNFSPLNVNNLICRAG